VLDGRERDWPRFTAIKEYDCYDCQSRQTVLDLPACAIRSGGYQTQALAITALQLARVVLGQGIDLVSRAESARLCVSACGERGLPERVGRFG